MKKLECGRKEAAILIEKRFPYVVDSMCNLSGVLKHATIGQRMIMAEGRMSDGNIFQDHFVARGYGLIVENLIEALKDASIFKLDYTAIFYPSSWQMPNFPRITVHVPDTGDPVEDGVSGFLEVATSLEAQGHGIAIGLVILIGEFAKHGLMPFVVPKDKVQTVRNAIEIFRQTGDASVMKRHVLELDT